MPDAGEYERVPSEGSRTLVAVSERVAVVETKIGGLKEDTVTIRAHIHEINNRMTEFVAAEIRCADALTSLLGMKPIVDQLLAHSQRGSGTWRALTIVGAALMGAVSTGAILMGGVIWLLRH